MYYVSKETFESLPDDIKEQVLKDTKEIAGIKDDKKSIEEQSEEDSENMSLKDKAEAQEYENDMASENSKNSVKSFDDAHDKGMALIIGVGKPKGKPKKIDEE